MKKLLLPSIATALLLFSGCSSKEPAVDAKPEAQKQAASQQNKSNTGKNGGEASDVATEEVSSNMQQVGSESMENANSNEMNMMNLQSKYQTIYFDFDRFDVRGDMQEIVQTDAAVAKNAPGSFNIKLEGNCDEWGSDEYNFALGLKRAKAVKEALVAEGVSSSSVSMVSFGESNPVCNDHTKECWAKNRRVDVKVIP